MRLPRRTSLAALPLLALVAAGCAPPTQVIIVVAPPAAVASEAQAEPAYPPAEAVRPTKLQGRIFALPPGTARLPDFAAMEPVGSLSTNTLDVTHRRFDQGFPGVNDRFEWFGIDFHGTFTVAVAGDYRFRLTSDDGARLYVDGKLLIDDDGTHPPTAVEGVVALQRGQHRIHVPYFQGPRDELALVLEVATDGAPFHVFRTDRPLPQD